MQQSDDRGDLHLFCFDLLAQEFGRSADHQTADEYGDDHEDVEVQKAYTYSAIETVDHHAPQCAHARQWRKAVVHGVYRAVGGDGRRYGPIGAGSGAEPHLLTFHAPRLLLWSQLS